MPLKEILGQYSDIYIGVSQCAYLMEETCFFSTLILSKIVMPVKFFFV